MDEVESKSEEGMRAKAKRRRKGRTRRKRT